MWIPKRQAEKYIRSKALNALLFVTLCIVLLHFLVFEKTKSGIVRIPEKVFVVDTIVMHDTVTVYKKILVETPADTTGKEQLN